MVLQYVRIASKGDDHPVAQKARAPRRTRVVGKERPCTRFHETTTTQSICWGQPHSEGTSGLEHRPPTCSRHFAMARSTPAGRAQRAAPVFSSGGQAVLRSQGATIISPWRNMSLQLRYEVCPFRSVERDKQAERHFTMASSRPRDVAAVPPQCAKLCTRFRPGR
jgi:hypothetical protein